MKDIAAVIGQSSYLGGYLTPVGEIGGVGAENRHLPRTLVNSCRMLADSRMYVRPSDVITPPKVHSDGGIGVFDIIFCE